MSSHDGKIEMRIWEEEMPSQSVDSLREILIYLGRRLGAYLNRATELCDFNVEARIGGSCALLVKSDCRSPVDLEWEGMIHWRLPEDFEEQQTQIYANLLAFMDGERIGLQTQAGKSVLHLRYEQGTLGVGEWKCASWSKDDYGEWDEYRTPSWR